LIVFVANVLFSALYIHSGMGGGGMGGGMNKGGMGG